MIFLNNTPIVDPEVTYQGTTLPPKPPLVPVGTDPTVFYSGQQLPEQAAPVQRWVVDPSNDPNFIAIGTVFLPNNTQMIVPKGEKILAESQILDGVSVFEHISRKAYEIDFEFLLWDNSWNSPFPQQQINSIWNDIWLPNSVQQVQNTFLNGIGIMEIIIKSISPKPRLGSTNVMVKIKAFENQAGASIIIKS